MSVVKKVQRDGMEAKIFKTSYGFYFRIYKNKTEIAQMFYYAHTLKQTEEELDKAFDIIDTEKVNKL